MDRDTKIAAGFIGLTILGAIVWVALLATVNVYGPLVSSQPPALRFVAEIAPPLVLMFLFYRIGKQTGRKEAEGG